jgi:hypothetical protein
MKLIVLLAGLLVVPSAMFGQVTLTGFGSGQFTVDNGITASGSWTQFATSLSVTVSDLYGTFAGTFTPVNITGITSTLVLTATVTSNPGSAFRVEIYDASLSDRSTPKIRTASYSGNWSSFAPSVPSSVALMPYSVDSGFDYSTVQGFQLLLGGAGSTLAVSFDTLATSAVPEPSAYAGIFGLCVLGATAWLRRRRQ